MFDFPIKLGVYNWTGYAEPDGHGGYSSIELKWGTLSNGSLHADVLKIVKDSSGKISLLFNDQPVRNPSIFSTIESGYPNPRALIEAVQIAADVAPKNPARQTSREDNAGYGVITPPRPQPPQIATNGTITRATDTTGAATVTFEPTGPVATALGVPEHTKFIKGPNGLMVQESGGDQTPIADYAASHGLPRLQTNAEREFTKAQNQIERAATNTQRANESVQRANEAANNAEDLLAQRGSLLPDSGAVPSGILNHYRTGGDLGDPRLENKDIYEFNVPAAGITNPDGTFLPGGRYWQTPDGFRVGNPGATTEVPPQDMPALTQAIGIAKQDTILKQQAGTLTAAMARATPANDIRDIDLANGTHVQSQTFNSTTQGRIRQIEISGLPPGSSISNGTYRYSDKNPNVIVNAGGQPLNQEDVQKIQQEILNPATARLRAQYTDRAGNTQDGQQGNAFAADGNNFVMFHYTYRAPNDVTVRVGDKDYTKIGNQYGNQYIDDTTHQPLDATRDRLIIAQINARVTAAKEDVSRGGVLTGLVQSMSPSDRFVAPSGVQDISQFNNLHIGGHTSRYYSSYYGRYVSGTVGATNVNVRDIVHNRQNGAVEFTFNSEVNITENGRPVNLNGVHVRYGQGADGNFYAFRQEGSEWKPITDQGAVRAVGETAQAINDRSREILDYAYKHRDARHSYAALGEYQLPAVQASGGNQNVTPGTPQISTGPGFR